MDLPFTDKKKLAYHYANVRKRIADKAFVPPPQDEGPRPEEKVPEVKPFEISPELMEQYRSIPTSPKKILIKKIIADTEDKYGFERGVLRRRSRERKYVKARHEAMFRLRQEVNCGYAEIGRIFEMDHTTILHGVKKYESEHSGA